MNVVGFDVSKDSLSAARIDRSGIVKQHFILTNTKEDIEPLLMALRAKYKHLLLASEATGDYHRVLAQTSLNLGIPFRLLNPIVTKQYTRATVRKRKTDRTDAEVIARVAMQGEGALITPDSFNNTKPLLRASVKLTQLSHMVNLLNQHLKRVLPEDTTATIELDKCLSQLDNSAKILLKLAMATTEQSTRKLLESIPGIGPLTSTTLIAEVGDITRFKGPKQLIAYIGLDPKVRQSGTTLNRNGRLTKRGSPYLRRWVIGHFVELFKTFCVELFAQRLACFGLLLFDCKGIVQPVSFGARKTCLDGF